MGVRRSAIVLLAPCVLASMVASRTAQAGAAPTPVQPPPAADAVAGAVQQQPNQFSINEAHGDWAVRCALTEVKSPAPCDVIQVTVNQDTKQRVMSLSFAYVPSRDAYAMQAVVPTGVALARGLTLAAGDVSLNGLRFSRCERDGCYVELLVDAPTVMSLSAAGPSTTVSVVGYGQSNELSLPVSLNGFTEALQRMLGLAKDRAVDLPDDAPTPAPISGTPNTAAPATPAQ